jgi:hypothetical protein
MRRPGLPRLARVPCQGVATGPAARPAAARPAHPLPQNRPRPLDCPGAGGRPQPPRAADDSGSGPCNPAPVPGANRRIPSYQSGSKSMACPKRKRARAGTGQGCRPLPVAAVYDRRKPILFKGVQGSNRVCTLFFHGNPILAQKNVLANAKTRTNTV